MSDPKLPEVRPLPEIEGDQKDYWDFLHPNLPKPPFVWYLAAPMGSGKTTIINHLMYALYCYPEGHKLECEEDENGEKPKDGRPVMRDASGEVAFDSVIFMSTTAGNDDNARYILSDPKVTFIEIPRSSIGGKKERHEDRVDKILCDIYDKQYKLVEEAREKGKREPHLLLILDDMLGLITNHSNFVSDCSRLRQPRITLVLTSQHYRSIPVLIRMNAWCLSIFRLTEKSGISIAEEWADFCPKDEFFRAMCDCKKGKDGKPDKHKFMTIDRSKTKLWKDAFVEEIPVRETLVPELEDKTEEEKVTEHPEPEAKQEIVATPAPKPAAAPQPQAQPKAAETEKVYLPVKPKQAQETAPKKPKQTCAGRTKAGKPCKYTAKFGRYCGHHRQL